MRDMPMRDAVDTACKVEKVNVATNYVEAVATKIVDHNVTIDDLNRRGFIQCDVALEVDVSKFILNGGPDPRENCSGLADDNISTMFQAEIHQETTQQELCIR